MRLTPNQKAMLRSALDSGEVDSGRGGWNAAHVRSLHRLGLVGEPRCFTWEEHWPLTDAGRAAAEAALAEQRATFSASEGR